MVVSHNFHSDRHQCRRFLIGNELVITAVLVVQGTSDHQCLYRVQMDVPADLEKISFVLYKAISIPALEYMASIFVSSIKIHAIGMKQFLHDLMKRIRLRFKQHMKMIGHQAQGMKFKRISFHCPGYMHEEGKIIVMIFI